MLAPLPLKNAYRLPVTSGTMLLSIAVTIAYWNHFNIAPLYTDSTDLWCEPWRLLSSVLPHANFMHIAFNLYWFWVFGSRLETAFGPVRYAALILLFAFTSSAAEIAFLDGGIGLSGVGYGIFGLVWILSKKSPKFMHYIDAQTIGLFVLWFFLCIILTVTNIMPIANIAHGAGAVVGIVTGYAITASPLRRRLLTAAIFMIVVVSYLGSTFLRPYLNFSSDGGSREAFEGWKALDAHRDEEGKRLLRTATRYRHADAKWWYNLGVADCRLRQWPEALAAFETAYRMDPSYKEAGDAILSVRLMQTPAPTTSRPAQQRPATTQ